MNAVRTATPADNRPLPERLAERVPKAEFDFMLRQRGMFSYSGLTAAQVARLRSEFAIYAIDTGRITLELLAHQDNCWIFAMIMLGFTVDVFMATKE